MQMLKRKKYPYAKTWLVGALATILYMQDEDCKKLSNTERSKWDY